ncbi:MAG: molybdopterin-dependent oxidoreductase, partial [Eggerthellaceae bacterium]|nr:molybdopterin-dependent oxidoreductase [Eggerthellaceae bacterium]
VPAADRSTNFDLAMRFVNAFGATRLEGPSIDLGPILGLMTDMGGIISNNKYLLNNCDDLIVIWASNPIAFTRPGETTNMLMKARERGCKIVQISNLFDVTSAKVDQWIPIKSGTDAAFALAAANVIINESLYNAEALSKRTAAAYLVRQDTGTYLRAAEVDPETGRPDQYVYIDAATGKPCFADKDVGEKAVGAIGSSVASDSMTTDAGIDSYQKFKTNAEDDAKGYAATDVYNGRTPDIDAVLEVNGIACKTAFAMLREHLEAYTPENQEAITGVPAETCRTFAREFAGVPAATLFMYDGLRYANAAQAYRAMYLLAYLTGNLGRKGGTMLPSPLDYYPTTQLNINALWYPTPDIHKAKQETFQSMVDSFSDPNAPQQYKVWFNTYANPFLNWPNKNLWLNRVLPNLDLFVAVDIRMSDTCKYADYVLPEATIYERYEVIPGPNECVILSEPAIEPLGESRDIAQIFQGLSQRLGIGEHFDKSLKEWCEFKMAQPGSSGSYIMAPITAEEDPERVGEIAPVTFERLEKVKYLHIDCPEEQFDNYKGRTYDSMSGKIEFYSEYLGQIGKGFADYEPALIHDEEKRAKYPLQFYPGRHKYFMQSQFTNIPELVALATSTQDGLALNPVTAAEKGLKDGDEVEVFNERGCIRTTLRLREDIAPGIAHMWYSFKEDHYSGTDTPQHLMTAQNVAEDGATSESMGMLTTMFWNVMQMYGVPRSASFFVENKTPEIIWDALCDVRKVGE